MKTLCDEVIVNSDPFQQEMASVVAPEPMCKRYEHPDRENAIAQYCKRFNT